MAKANDLAKRNTKPYWSGANWKIAPGLDPSQRAKYYDELDERAECLDDLFYCLCQVAVI